jgi:hypothetical protein
VASQYWRDEPGGTRALVTDYTRPSDAPQPDRITLSYNPPDPQQSRGWAFNAAVGSTMGAALISAFTAPFAGTIAAHFNAPLGVVVLSSVAGLVLPLMWPVRTYCAQNDTWEQTSLDYHEAAIERLRNRPPPTSTTPPAAPAIPRNAPDAGEMFYLQCAAALARATVDPSAPRKASEKIATVTSDGVAVIITKDEYKNVAGMLCELGFMIGGEGQEPRNYAIAPKWADTEVPDLLRALKTRKAEIVARVRQ